MDKLAKEGVDAVFLTLAPEPASHLDAANALSPLTKAGIPTFSLAGGRELKAGALLGTGKRMQLALGRYLARIVADIIGGIRLPKDLVHVSPLVLSLNMQSATMWTYCMKEYAQWYAGAQYLNLTSTPAKAASFIVAKAIFENTPIGRTYDPLVNEQIGENYAISKANNSSVWSDSEKFYHSGDALEWCPVPVSDEVNSIVGIGNSQIVEYSGTGIYFIDDIDGKLHITLEPNHEWVGEPWNSKNPGITCNLDYDTANTLSIRLKDWGEGQYTVSRIEDGAETVVTGCTALENLSLAPGDYVVTRTE